MSAIASPSITSDEPSIDDLKADFDEGFSPDEHRADEIPASCICSVCCSP